MPVEELGVKALDERTLEITLERPTPYFLGGLKHYTAYPIPEHLIEEHGEDWVKIGNIATNGPYVPVDWVPGSHVTTEKNPSFHDAENVSIEGAKFFVLEDESAAFKRYRAGEFDIMTEFPTDQYAWMQENLPGEARVAPYAGLYYYVVNNEKPPFDDARVRQALSMAINREVIGPQILGTGELPAYSWVPPGMEGYGEPATVSWKDMAYPEKLEEAKRLLGEAGFGRGRRAARRAASLQHQREPQAHRHRDRLDVEAARGERRALQHRDQGALRRAAARRARGGPRRLARRLQRPGQLPQPPEGRHRLQLRPLLEPRVRRADRRGERRDRSGRAGGDPEEGPEQIALDETAAMPIYYYVSRNVVSPKVSGFEDNVFDIHRTRWLTLED